MGAVAATVAFVRLGRPHFLVGGFLLYGLGAAVALAVAGAAGTATAFDLRAYALGQAAITCIQLMTHYANDYFDLAADRANLTPTRWSGGSRVLPSGVLSPRVALVAALALAVAALALTVTIARARKGDGGGAAAATLLGATLLAWCYSAPPLTLHSRGLGELTTAVVVTVLTPLTGFLLQAGGGRQASSGLPTLAAALLPLFGLQVAMLLAIELPDAAGDAATGKRTLVVRWGARRAAAALRVALVVVYGALPLLALGPLPRPAAMGAALAFPLALWQFSRLGGAGWGRPDLWAGLAFRGVAMVAVSSAGELIAFCWLAIRP